MSNANILIGLGGTGAKILCELAELLSQDGRWVSDADTDLFFLLIDTDTGDLDRCEGVIRQYLPSVYCATVSLARDLANLAPLLQPWHDKFTEVKSQTGDEYAAGIRRFAEHWWFADPKKPTFEPSNAFDAHRVINIHEGAGQVPAVSHFCAWNRMEDISAAYLDLFNAVSKRRANMVDRTTSPISQSNVFFLGSFAGGTGRGALIPSAFRFKQDFFQRFQQPVSPSLYVLDASCFEKLLSKPELPAVYLNSLSGFSELSAWEELHKAPEGRNLKELFYFLPGATNPADPEHDVIGFSRVDPTNQKGFIRPFDAVSITCRQAMNIEASKPEQLYSMLAGALYVRMTQSSVNSQRANNGRSLLAIGSASCRVDAQSIKGYFRDKAQYDTLYQLQAPVEPSALRAAAVGWADEILARRVGLKEAPTALLAQNPPAEKGNARSIFEMFTFLMFQDGAFGATAMDALNQALHNQDLTLVEDALMDRFDSNRKLADENFSSEISNLFARAIEEFARIHGLGEFQDAGTWTKAVAEDIASSQRRLHESVFAKTGSAALAGAVAGVIRQRLAAFSTHDLSRAALVKLLDETEPDLSGLVESVKGKAYILTGERFDAVEIDKVMGTARQVLMLMAAQALGLVLKSDSGPFAPLRALLGHIETNAKCVADASGFLIQDIDPEALEKTRKECFVTRGVDGRVKWQELTNSLLDFDSDQRFVKRIIKPLEPTKEDGLHLALGEFGTVISGILSGNEIPEAKRTPVMNPELTDDMRHALSRHVRYVAYSPAAGIQQDVTTLVQFGQTIRKLWDAWTNELNHQLQGTDFESLSQKFYNFFGVQPRMTPNRDAVRVDMQVDGVSPQNHPILAMAISLARTCHAFWKLKNAAAAADPHVIIMIPIDIQDDEVNKWQAYLQDEVKGRVDLIRNKAITLANGTRVSYNPFILSVYCSEGTTVLDNIDSLNYWSTKPKIKDLMSRIERTDWVPAQFATAEGKDASAERESLFPGYRGSGFADPCYLFNPTLKTLRWRPWIPEEERKADRLQEEIGHVSLLTLYAVWGAEAFLTDADQKDKALMFLRTCKWPETAILQTKDKEWLALQRFPGELNIASVPPTYQPSPGGIGYHVGANIEQSLGNMSRVFMKQKEPRYGSGDGAAALFDGVKKEFAHFCEQVGDHCGFHPKKNTRAYGELMQRLAKRISDHIAENSPAEDDRLVFENAHQAAISYSRNT